MLKGAVKWVVIWPKSLAKMYTEQVPIAWKGVSGTTMAGESKLNQSYIQGEITPGNVIEVITSVWSSGQTPCSTATKGN